MITPGDPNWRDGEQKLAGRWSLGALDSTAKIKRGLGLLLLAAVAFIVQAATLPSSSSAPVLLAQAALNFLAIGLGLVGLVLLAWGLLGSD